MSKGKKKMMFEVQENETIGACLDRIQKAGYMPVRRTEKPVFEEKIVEGSTIYEPIGRQIVFEAKLIET
ncbi:NETI motif-containing protein [Bacillus sp. S/N-304-OC-R1]|uniref:NETI motif-containing protein n=1 Tax=Bacillus sp. S/N-304-OC-R1 TaxID=2758034 RepID=UPI001C8D34AF|nr:NETI motif-containing protein [Bacillus sp. S/N-304-OC-R1]MBY0122249.1 NETI motif-containing protein [Bacillus sp. S/N-304-OC-R1]